ncbi:MAG: L-2-hydroxyglutarate oxidase [Acidimicrobiia bacterium]|nr:L-2-hydroxyglutarate oxidase [Acidimicrobiia bacterium]
MTDRHDVIIVGGGIVGLATARALTQSRPGLDVIVLEKESKVGDHQTGNNSGVLHSGLYYKPGSLKARLCVEGRQRMVQFCEDENLPMRMTGKLVIATQSDELPALDELERRGNANGLKGLTRIGPDGIKDHEPHAVGMQALHVPEVGVADFAAVARRLADNLDGAVRVRSPVTRISEDDGGVVVETPQGIDRASILINCAGLHSDRVAAMAGLDTPVRIVPFRGEYHLLTEVAAPLVKELIYPVPDPRFPFLGVHFTRRVNDTVEVGPNAVLALGREHYRNRSANWSDVWETVRYPGFLRLASHHWRTGSTEMWRSRSRRLYARSAQRLVPEIRAEHFTAGGAGVRAQAVSADGKLVDDFSVVEGPSSIHVLNAPSPAATASLAIGDHIAAMAEARAEHHRRP